MKQEYILLKKWFRLDFWICNTIKMQSTNAKKCITIKTIAMWVSADESWDDKAVTRMHSNANKWHPVQIRNFIFTL